MNKMQFVSGEYDDLYEDDLGAKRIKLMDEMILVYTGHEYDLDYFNENGFMNKFYSQVISY